MTSAVMTLRIGTARTSADTEYVKPSAVEVARRYRVRAQVPHSWDITLLSEASLARDWDRPEEDEAWAYLLEE